MDLWFYIELMPKLRLFKVQGMGYGQWKPERRSSGFENGSARQIQFSKNSHAHPRDLEDLDVDLESWVSLFHRGLFSFPRGYLSSWMTALTAQCELVLCVTTREELQSGVDLESLMCCATPLESGNQGLSVEEGQDEPKYTLGGAPRGGPTLG